MNCSYIISLIDSSITPSIYWCLSNMDSGEWIFSRIKEAQVNNQHMWVDRDLAPTVFLFISNNTRCSLLLCISLCRTVVTIHDLLIDIQEALLVLCDGSLQFLLLKGCITRFLDILHNLHQFRHLKWKTIAWIVPYKSFKEPEATYHTLIIMLATWLHPIFLTVWTQTSHRARLGLHLEILYWKHITVLWKNNLADLSS